MHCIRYMTCCIGKNDPPGRRFITTVLLVTPNIDGYIEFVMGRPKAKHFSGFGITFNGVGRIKGFHKEVTF